MGLSCNNIQKRTLNVSTVHPKLSPLPVYHPSVAKNTD